MDIEEIVSIVLRNKNKTKEEIMAILQPSDTMEIYTDGSCIGNPGSGGWAFVVSPRGLTDGSGEPTTGSGSNAHTTNNQMELMAALQALEYVKTTEFRKVRIFTDSVYLKNGITKWITNWKRNGWQTKAGKAVANKEIWVSLDGLCGEIDVTWSWVKAHNGDTYNEIADTLARDAANEKKSK